jgi:hypothetical protein
METFVKGEDEKQALAYKKRLDQLWPAAKFAEAAEPAEKLLDLRRRVQGQSHWQTVDAARRLETLRLVVRLPDEQQRELAESPDLMRRHQTYRSRGATPKLRCCIERPCPSIKRFSAGTTPTRPWTSTIWPASWKNKATTPRQNRCTVWPLPSVKRHWVRITPTRQAVSITLGHLQISMGKSAEVEVIYRRVLSVRQNVLGEDHQRHLQLILVRKQLQAGVQ